MANRNTLAVDKLDGFKTYLTSRGFSIEDPKGFYEVLRATHSKRKHPLIVYKRLDTNAGDALVHLSVMDRDAKIVREYIRFYKSQRRNEND